MKREIKFRAWDRTENKYCNPVLNNVDFNDIFNLPFYDYQQYTGLKDKNGKDIYEGDVVKLDETPEIIKGTEFHSMEDVSHHEIYWDNERACFYDKRLEDGDSLAAYLDGDISFVSDCELVGNIYENPELLK